MARRTIDDVDLLVGRRIAERRATLGMTQIDMSNQLSVSYQQLHKYEKGINRVSAGRLYEISKALQVPVDFFFEGIEA